MLEQVELWFNVLKIRINLKSQEPYVTCHLENLKDPTYMMREILSGIMPNKQENLSFSV